MKTTLFTLFLSVFILIGLFSCNSDLSEEEILQQPPPAESVTTKALKPFPTVNEIKNNPTVSSAMNRLWLQTLSSANRYGRREFGFYIYFNRNTGFYSVGPDISGPLVSGCVGTQASIYPGIPSDNTTVCAFFHTHTPLTYCTTGYRSVGPSSTDISWANSNNLPCLLYDYSSNIRAGHSLNAMATIYTFGPYRRPSY